MNAQDDLCVPDSTLAGGGAYVYPEPYHPRLNPNGGVIDTACINHQYSFVFTAVVPDSLNGIKIDFIEIEENGVLDIPSGLKYKCNPPNCNFPSGTLGCFELYDKPALGNELKNYDLKMKVKISAADGLIVINDTLPMFINDSAHYYLPLLGEDCVLANEDIIKQNDFVLTVLTNPASEYIRLAMYNNIDRADMKISLVDISGRVIFNDNIEVYGGDNRLDLNIQGINKGMYFLKAVMGKTAIVKKIVIE